jgi:GTP-binding protein
VGRPNVGKSTLFNRLVGKRLALVDDRPGVTRDRREGEARLYDLDFTVVDTAGFEEAAPESLAGRMRQQTETALAEADLVLMMVDARAGITPMDQVFAQIVRRSGKPAILLANKAEGKAGAAGALEAYALGLGDPVEISAEHGEGMGELYDALRALAPGQAPAAAEPAAEEKAEGARGDAIEAAEATGAESVPGHPIRVAVVGRPNAGKSTLINRLLGEERLLTGPEAGITRDSISVPLAWGGQRFQVHDTAGLRKRARIDEKLEKLSVADALRAIKFAEVVVVLMDAERPFEEQDLRIADLVVREGRALVIGINKWDLAPKPGAASKLRDEVDHRLPQVKGVPIVALSGLTGAGLDRLMAAILDAHAVWNRRVPTAGLNRWLGAVTASHPPPAVSGRRLKLNYITQAKARPPSFVLFASRADALPEDYKRYLVNALRETFDLPGTPIRLTVREKENPYAGRAKGKG